ncbi:MAG: DUF3703 domain-containing protein [Brachymonas sp.]
MLSTITEQVLASEPDAISQVAWLLKQAKQERAYSPAAWSWLEAAHIVGQTRLDLHGRVHGHILLRAWAERKWREVFAQILRIALVPIGHLAQRLPMGNPGSSRVGALKSVPVPPYLVDLIVQSRAMAAPSQ